MPNRHVRQPDAAPQNVHADIRCSAPTRILRGQSSKRLYSCPWCPHRMDVGRAVGKKVNGENMSCTEAATHVDYVREALACAALASSFSSIMAPSCETLPAPSVRTMSPGRATAAAAATAAEKDGEYATLPFPAAAMRPARASAVMPSMGLSLAG